MKTVLRSKDIEGWSERMNHPQGQRFNDWWHELLFSRRDPFIRSVLRETKEALWQKWKEVTKREQG